MVLANQILEFLVLLRHDPMITLCPSWVHGKCAAQYMHFGGQPRLICEQQNQRQEENGNPITPRPKKTRSISIETRYWHPSILKRHLSLFQRTAPVTQGKLPARNCDYLPDNLDVLNATKSQTRALDSQIMYIEHYLLLLGFHIPSSLFQKLLLSYLLSMSPLQFFYLFLRGRH